jgi:antitoxin StbD
LFEAMMEELADQELYRKAASRLADKSRAIEVGIDDL